MTLLAVAILGSASVAALAGASSTGPRITIPFPACHLQGLASMACPAPEGVAFAQGAAWVPHSDNHIYRIDPSTNRAVAIPFHGRVQFGAGGAWGIAYKGFTPSVNRYETTNFSAVATIPIPARDPRFQPNVSLGVGANAVWVAKDDGAILRIDPATNAVVATIPVQFALGFAPIMAVGPDAVWAVSETYNPASRDYVERLVRVDPATNQVTTSPPLDFRVRTLTLRPVFGVGAGDVWFVDGDGIHRVSSRTFRIIATIDLPAVGELAFDRSTLWVALGDRGIARVNVRTNKVTRTVKFKASSGDAAVAGDVAVGGGAVWVILGDDNVLVRIRS